MCGRVVACRAVLARKDCPSTLCACKNVLFCAEYVRFTKEGKVLKCGRLQMNQECNIEME
jgi:hypothetical protein